jgi:hypothetical protein
MGTAPPRGAADDKYTTGALARYYPHVQPDAAPPDSKDPPPDTAPTDDLEVRKYRGIGMPTSGDGTKE